MGVFRDKILAQIDTYERELVRIDVDAATAKLRAQRALATLRQAEAALTDDFERLLAALGAIGIKFEA